MKIRTARGVAAVLLSSAALGCSVGEGPSSPSSPSTQTTGAASTDEPSDAAQTSDDEGATDGTEEDEPLSEASFDPESTQVLVNKQNPLDPQDFEPDDLRVVDVPNEFGGPQMRDEPAGALEELFEAAEQDGISLWATTAYREYHFQKALYDQYLQEQGQDAADRISARPGYSEHQTGLVVDVADLEDRSCYLRGCFAETEQGEWLAEHAHHFGFIIRYPQGAEPITGYTYEPWHLRFVGEDVARHVASRDVTLEQYWDQPPAPEYEHSYAESPDTQQ